MKARKERAEKRTYDAEAGEFCSIDNRQPYQRPAFRQRNMTNATNAGICVATKMNVYRFDSDRVSWIARTSATRRSPRCSARRRSNRSTAILSTRSCRSDRSSVDQFQQPDGRFVVQPFA